MLNFRNFTLRGRDLLSFVKYNNRVDLNGLNSVDELPLKLKKAVASCRYFPDDSDFQGYLIYRGEPYVGYPIGLMVLDAKNRSYLQVNLEFTESILADSKPAVVAKITEITEDIINALKLSFYEKRSIKVKVFNDLLINYDYDNAFYQPSDLTLTEANERHNYLPKLIDEMRAYEDLFMSLNLGWEETYLDFSDTVDYVTQMERLSHRLPMEQIFNYAEGVEWKNIQRKNKTAKVVFNRDGKVLYTSIDKGYKDGLNNGRLYTSTSVEYNIGTPNTFSLLANFYRDGYHGAYVVNNMANTRRIHTNLIFDSIGQGIDCYTKMELDKKTGLRTYNVIIDSSYELTAICLQLAIKANGELDHCYVDFDSIKASTGKINGSYLLRIYPSAMTLSFVHRKGDKNNYQLGDDIDKLIASQGHIDVALLTSLIGSALEKINVLASRRGYNYQIPFSIEDILETEKMITNQLKTFGSIVGNTNLKERINNATEDTKLGKVKTYE